ncbi:hypothetical protein LXL04_020436 [Taraxacum kok-saghyz]
MFFLQAAPPSTTALLLLLNPRYVTDFVLEFVQNACSLLLKLKQPPTSHSYDIVVVGAGIIGLSIARQLLISSDLSVAVVDAAVPCSGATGAGASIPPGIFAMRSRQLWEKFAHDIKLQGLDPQDVLGWKKTGSLLVGKTSDDMAVLKGKVDQLSKAGLKAELLSSLDLKKVEPLVVVGEEGGGAFLPNCYQLDARRSVAYIEKENRKYAKEGRYREYYNQPVTGWLRSGNGEVDAGQGSPTGDREFQFF